MGGREVQEDPAKGIECVFAAAKGLEQSMGGNGGGVLHFSFVYFAVFDVIV